jgi:hypothetical protein
MNFATAHFGLAGLTSFRTGLVSPWVRATGRGRAACASGLFSSLAIGGCMQIGPLSITASCESGFAAFGIWADFSCRFVLLMAGPFILSFRWEPS